MPTSSPTLVYVYKKYQCRYFDASGRPLNPPCNQGENCRFLHPGDSNWPGLKPHEKRMNTATSSAGFGDPGSRRKRSNDEIVTWEKTKQPDPNCPEPRLERHSNPLVSQTDLFLQCKVEGDDTTSEGRSQLRRRVNPGQDDAYNRDRNRGRERKRGRESRSRHTSPNFSGHYDMRDSLNRGGPGGIPKLQPYYEPENPNTDSVALTEHKGSLVIAEKDYEKFKVDDHAPEVPLVPSPSSLQEDSRSNCKARATQVAEIFRHLAKLSNQATQDSEVQAKEERKVQIYTELSSTLSKISTNGTTSVMPNLANIILKNAERKQRVDDNFKSIAGLWEQAFEIFVTEISHVLNDQLQKAMKEIRQAGDSVCSSRVVNAVGTLERCRPEASRSSSSADQYKERSGSRRGPPGKEKELKLTRKEHAAQPEYKRRRYAAPSPSPDETRPMNPQPVTEEVQQSMQEILCQMKLKIDEQAQSLQKLTKENNELKASLNRQMSTSPRGSRFSFPTISQVPSQGLSKGRMTPTTSSDQFQSQRSRRTF